MFGRIHRGICDREAAVLMVLETVANVDPEVAPVMRKKEQARYSDQSRLVRSLKRHGRLRAGLSVPHGQRHHLGARHRAQLPRSRPRARPARRGLRGLADRAASCSPPPTVNGLGARDGLTIQSLPTASRSAREAWSERGRQDRPRQDATGLELATFGLTDHVESDDG
jgi:hypothetical protein